MASERQYAASC